MSVAPNGWTVVASSGALFAWHFIDGHDAKTLWRAIERGDVIAMQKRAGEGEFQLLVRPTCPAWRRIRRWIAEHPLPSRQVRR